MSTENEKLLKVKKSCKAVKLVALILLILGIVGGVLALGSSIAIFAMGEKFDNTILEAEEKGYINSDDIEASVGGVLNVSIFKVNLGDPTSFTSSIPALQARFDAGSLSTLYSIYLLAIFSIILITNIVILLIYLIFRNIEHESTPFCDKVIRKMVVIFILLTLVTVFTLGTGFAVLAGLMSWAIITIMEYGKQLQIQSDETL
ncbi:MAG: hypothetical protein K5776_06265 [Lachnospiraceae bacterium]|nr:hypothetical protein [Lachnospiraceae bacterium]